MGVVYIDTNSGLLVGVLDEKLNWLSLDLHDDEKPSEVIHSYIHTIVELHNFDILNTKFIFSAGPGSYTGMRVSEGLAQILELSSVSVYSFYHYDVPKLLGIEKGIWFTDAFKQQVFQYEWDNTSRNQKLVETVNFKNENTHFFSTAKKDNFVNEKNTNYLIQNNPNVFFGKIFENKSRVSPYYFRTLDEEFKSNA